MAGRGNTPVQAMTTFLTGGRGCTGAGLGRTGLGGAVVNPVGAATNSAGRSAVRMASTPQVREPNAWPTRESSSSLVSLPWTNAAWRIPITCSQSACDARIWPWPTSAAP